jgi:hypothetical protein
LIKPRRQIGPDAIMMLRHFSRYMRGDKFHFDGCRVQRNAKGQPNAEFDFNNMAFFGAGHPDTYGVLVRDIVTPEALKWAARLKGQDPSLMLHTLRTLLNKGGDYDSTNWWVCSHPVIRSLLFPHAYDSNQHRVDRVLYLDRPNDRQNRGKACFLSDLKPASNQRFVEYASGLINEPFDPRTITPLTQKRASS